MKKDFNVILNNVVDIIDDNSETFVIYEKVILSYSSEETFYNFF